MKNIFHFIFLQILCPLCVRCHSLRVTESFFCKNCEIVFLNKYIKKYNRELRILSKNYKVQTIINWPPYQSDSISDVVYLLKSCLSFAAWKYYAQIFDFYLDCNRSIILIPVPSRKISKTAYHTRYFATALSQLYNCDVIDCLKSTSKDQELNQKNQDYLGRSRVGFKFNEEFTGLISTSTHIVLIDDIITTGYTISASIEALRPWISDDCKIDILTLFSREKT